MKSRPSLSITTNSLLGEVDVVEQDSEKGSLTLMRISAVQAEFNGRGTGDCVRLTFTSIF